MTSATAGIQLSQKTACVSQPATVRETQAPSIDYFASPPRVGGALPPLPGGPFGNAAGGPSSPAAGFDLPFPLPLALPSPSPPGPPRSLSITCRVFALSPRRTR